MIDPIEKFGVGLGSVSRKSSGAPLGTGAGFWSGYGVASTRRRCWVPVTEAAGAIVGRRVSKAFVLQVTSMTAVRVSGASAAGMVDAAPSVRTAEVEVALDAYWYACAASAASVAVAVWSW